MELVKPHFIYEQAFRDALAEISDPIHRSDWIYLGRAGYQSFFEMTFAEYVKLLELRETVAPEGFVPSSAYWAVSGGEIVGRISFRLRLNEWLAHSGGHVGYIVRPSRRGQGVAKFMLRELLERSELKSLERVLITCDENNPISERVIRSAGGVYESTVEVSGDPIQKKRFWVEVPH